MLTPEEERQLVQRLLAGEERALRDLYERYAPALLRAIRRLVDEEELAQDILQESLLRIWLHIARYDPNRGRLFTWMQRICCHHAIDVLRSTRHHRLRHARRLDADAARGLPAPPTFYPEHVGLRELTGRLPPPQRALIELLYYQGYTHVEAAAHLGIPLGTAKTRARTAVHALAKLAR